MMFQVIRIFLVVLLICADCLVHVFQLHGTTEPTAHALLHLRLRGGVSPMNEEVMALRELNSLALQVCGVSMENEAKDREFSTNKGKHLRKPRGPMKHATKVKEAYCAELRVYAPEPTHALMLVMFSHQQCRTFRGLLQGEPRPTHVLLDKYTYMHFLYIHPYINT